MCYSNFIMTDKWVKDTGLVFALIFLVLGFKYGEEFLSLSVAILFLSIFVPSVLYPLAFVWLKIAELLSLVVPRVLLSVVFFAIIFPIGILRQFIKGDTLCISGWRKVRTNFVDRRHVFSRQDLDATY